MSGSQLRVNFDLCQPQECGRLCEAIFPRFLELAPTQINTWTFAEYGTNYMKITNLIKHCPCEAVYLDSKDDK